MKTPQAWEASAAAAIEMLRNQSPAANQVKAEWMEAAKPLLDLGRELKYRAEERSRKAWLDGARMAGQQGAGADIRVGQGRSFGDGTRTAGSAGLSPAGDRGGR
ncbi:hypothetical protein [Nesterenkonia suensis]